MPSDDDETVALDGSPSATSPAHQDRQYENSLHPCGTGAASGAPAQPAYTVRAPEDAASPSVQGSGSGAPSLASGSVGASAHASLSASLHASPALRPSSPREGRDVKGSNEARADERVPASERTRQNREASHAEGFFAFRMATQDVRSAAAHG
jgi:hypothetical protein